MRLSRRLLGGESTPERSSTRLWPSSDFWNLPRMPKTTLMMSDTRKHPPPFINFEEHLNGTNEDFSIPALNLSLNLPATTGPERSVSEIIVPSAQNQSAVESILGRRTPSAVLSPTPTLMDESDTPMGLQGAPDTSRDVPAARSAPGTTRIAQFSIDARPRKLPPGSRKSDQGKNASGVSVRVNATAQSPSGHASLPQHHPMAPPIPPSRPGKAIRPFCELESDTRPVKRLKTIQAKNRVSCVIQCTRCRSHLKVSHMLFKFKR
jgi:hypothetical protein